MFGKGYVSKGQMLTDKQTLEKTRHELRKTEGELDVFRRYQAPKEIVAFRNEIAHAEKNLARGDGSVKAAEERLAYCRKQIANCTIRAAARRSRHPCEPGILVVAGA